MDSNGLSNLADDFIIVSLSESPLAFQFWRSRQCLMYEIANFTPVLYVNSRTYIREFGKISYWGKALFKKEIYPFDLPKRLIQFHSPFYIPKVYGFQRIDNYLANKFGELIRRRCSHFGHKRIVAYVWDPMLYDCLHGLGADIVIYHPYDRFVLFESSDQGKQMMIDAENRILHMADAVITPHQKIAKCLKHPNTHIVHNGLFMPAYKSVSYDKFMTKELLDVPAPLVGYIGVINSKVDFELLVNLARSRPDWSFVLLGPVYSLQPQKEISFTVLSKLPNVYLYPPVSFNEVPLFMKKLDIGIMPYDLSTWMSYCESPLKLYEYWAAGLTVVSTPLPYIEDEPGLLSVVSTPHEWIKAIDWGLCNNSDKMVKKRIKTAYENSWSERAKQVLEIIRSI